MPRVFCVAPQINQVILNLLVNAVQAIEAHRPQGGRIVIRTRRLPHEMLLEIEDNGCGIAPETKARLFDPFFTTKEAGEGTGLGLSITHNIVTAHGGRIEVDSRLGDGAAFRIFLPLGVGQDAIYKGNATAIGLNVSPLAAEVRVSFEECRVRVRRRADVLPALRDQVPQGP